MTKLEETTQIMIDAFTRGTIEAYNAGRQLERDRMTEVVRGHVAVCNYKAVTDEDCDVCFWANSVIAEMAETPEPEPDYENDIFNSETRNLLGKLTIRKETEN
jgi:hypothetical protein